MSRWQRFFDDFFAVVSRWQGHRAVPARKVGNQDATQHGPYDPLPQVAACVRGCGTRAPPPNWPVRMAYQLCVSVEEEGTSTPLVLLHNGERGPKPLAWPIVHRVSLPPTDVAHRSYRAINHQRSNSLRKIQDTRSIQNSELTDINSIFCCAMTLTCESEHRHKKSIQMNTLTFRALQGNHIVTDSPVV